MQTLPREIADPQNPSVPSLLTMATNPVTQWPAQAAANRFRALVQTILRMFGIDRAIAYTLIGRGWGVLSGPLTIVMIARFLRPEEQGFYYTFGSVIALNIFFELGLTYVLLQFASHEKAHLEWTPAGTLAGSELSKTRLAALLKLALRWYVVAASLILLLVLPGGIVFFSRYSAASATIAWRVPWIWLATASALNLLASPLFAVLEGCGKVAEMALMRVGQNIVANLGLWLALLCRGSLFAGPILETARLAFALTWLVVSYGHFFRALLQTDVAKAPFNWWTEVWPFQWRIALSWLSGYFIFQLFNPVLFASHGPVVAGQMGMSVNICTAIGGVCMAWMSTKASPLGVLVAKRQWQALDDIFFKTLWRSLLVLACGAVSLYTFVVVLHLCHIPLSKRVLPPIPFAFLLISTVLNHIVFCQAQYLRSHKAEPLLWPSIIMAVLTGGSTLLLAKPFGAFGVSAGYLACCTIGLVVCTKVFVQKRAAWHV